MNTCLFVIDVQESFRQRDYFEDSLVADYLLKQNQLIEVCQSKEIPIARVFHTDNDSVFSLDSGFVVPLQGLADFQESICIYKQRHSALVGTELPVWLVENDIKHLIVSGIRTEQCCETTTRHASDLGYEVSYVLDATLTFDMINKDGSTLTAEQIKQRTQTVLQDRFANVVSIQELVENL